MAERFGTRIKRYCEAHGIAIPAGFARHPPNRYAVIDLNCNPPKLVARTWFKQEDLLHYVARHPAPAQLRLLDFGDGCVLLLTPDGTLAPGEPL